MSEQLCNHENLEVLENNYDIKAVCKECGEEFCFYRATEGLYVFEFENQIYLLNTQKDIDVSKNSYSFEMNQKRVSLHQKEYQGKCKRIGSRENSSIQTKEKGK